LHIGSSSVTPTIRVSTLVKTSKVNKQTLMSRSHQGENCGRQELTERLACKAE
jgi:hypothetical protein